MDLELSMNVGVMTFLKEIVTVTEINLMIAVYVAVIIVDVLGVLTPRHVTMTLTQLLMIQNLVIIYHVGISVVLILLLVTTILKQSLMTLHVNTPLVCISVVLILSLVTTILKQIMMTLHVNTLHVKDV